VERPANTDQDGAASLELTSAKPTILSSRAQKQVSRLRKIICILRMTLLRSK
jgi:hypothetical protein